MISVYTAAEIDSMLAARLPEPHQPGSVVIPTFLNLFGPLPGNGFVVEPIGPEWSFLTAVTANTKLFDFWLGYPAVARARWMLVWTPNNIAMAARLVAFDQATAGQIQGEIELARIESLGHMTPVPQAVLITEKFQALVNAKEQRHIGMQLKGDGVNRFTIFESRLELNFALITRR